MEGKEGLQRRRVEDSQESRTWGTGPASVGREEQERSRKKTERKTREVSGQRLSWKKAFPEGKGSPQGPHLQCSDRRCPCLKVPTWRGEGRLPPGSLLNPGSQ